MNVYGLISVRAKKELQEDTYLHNEIRAAACVTSKFTMWSFSEPSEYSPQAALLSQYFWTPPTESPNMKHSEHSHL